MKRTIGHLHELTLSVRTESGKASISMGLEGLTDLERKFLFETLRKTHEGGSVQFGAKENVAGAIDITLRLTQPSVDAGVKAAIQ